MLRSPESVVASVGRSPRPRTPPIRLDQRGTYARTHLLNVLIAQIIEPSDGLIPESVHARDLLCAVDSVRRLTV